MNWQPASRPSDWASRDEPGRCVAKDHEGKWRELCTPFDPCSQLGSGLSSLLTAHQERRLGK